ARAARGRARARGAPRVEGGVALVSGGSGGIGRAIAVGLARAGAAVVGLARGAEGLAETGAEIGRAGGRFLAVPADLREGDRIAGAPGTARRGRGRVDGPGHAARGLPPGQAPPGTPPNRDQV